MGTYETLIFVLLGVTLFICGVWLGRKLERYEIYLKLLASRDPQAWTVAHKLREFKAPPQPDPEEPYPASRSPLVPRPDRPAQDRTTVKVKLPPKDTTSLPDQWRQ